MSARPSTVKRTYNCKNSEVRPLALIYISRLQDPATLQLFTNEDPAVDAAWLAQFISDNDAIRNIVSSRSLIKINTDRTKQIKALSKNCVKFGTKLSYWLPKAFPNEPGKVESFPIVPANDKMRSGDTEGLVELLQSIVQNINDNLAALQNTAWPPSNLTDYQNLITQVEAINTVQENSKSLVGENTDKATTIRNKAYSYIQTILQLNDIVFKESDPEKYRTYKLATLKKQISNTHSGHTAADDAAAAAAGTTTP